MSASCVPGLSTVNHLRAGICWGASSMWCILGSETARAVFWDSCLSRKGSGGQEHAGEADSRHHKHEQLPRALGQWVWGETAATDEECWARGGRILNRVIWESLSGEVMCEWRPCLRKQTLSWRVLQARELSGSALGIHTCSRLRADRLDREKLSCNVSATKVAADPMGGPGAGITLQSYPELRWGAQDFYTARSTIIRHRLPWEGGLTLVETVLLLRADPTWRRTQLEAFTCCQHSHS